MKLIIGLGNPGKKYDNTRHNIGFRIIDTLVDSIDAKFKRKWSFKYAAVSNKAIIIKPMTFMNLSGRAALEARNFFSATESLVVTDDIYLPLGVIRLRQKGSDGGHKGIRSIINIYGNDQFIRLRVGVGTVSSDDISSSDFQQRELSSYVLSRFTSEENETLDSSTTDCVDLLKTYIDSSFEETLKKYSQIKANKK